MVVFTLGFSPWRRIPEEGILGSAHFLEVSVLS